ncbi:hypothetical protein [Aureisphaera sp.]
MKQARSGSLESKIIAHPEAKGRSHRLLLTWLAILAVFGFFLGLSLQNDSLFLKELLLCAFIIGFLLFFKGNA